MEPGSVVPRAKFTTKMISSTSPVPSKFTSPGSMPADPNENIFISGIAEQKDLFINWTFEKIS